MIVNTPRTFVHFQHLGSLGLIKTKLLIMTEQLYGYIAVTFRFRELSVCGRGREHEKM